MVNLIKNENMKIYRRLRTWVMVGLLVMIVAAGCLIMWYDTGRHNQGDDWKNSIEQQIASNNMTINDPNMDDEIKEDLTEINKELQYRLDHNIKPLQATMWGAMLDMAGVVFLITLFVVIIAGDTIAGEFSTGTIKLLLIRPASRTKIMLSKYLAALLFAIFLLIVLFVVSLLFSGIFYGFSGLDQPFLHTTDDGVLQERSMLIHLWSTYFFNTISTVMFVTMAFMISAVFRSSAMAIGISIFAMLAGDLVTMFLSRFEWSKYLLFANLNLQRYLMDAPFKEGMTMGFSIAVLLVYFAIFHLAAWLVFTKRDVAA